MVEMSNPFKTFLCTSTGSTLEFLSNFTCHRARTLLKNLNRHTYQWYFKNE